MSKTILEKALIAAGFAALVLDETECIVDISQPAADLLGFDGAELIGRPVADFLQMDPVKTLILSQTPITPLHQMVEITLRDRAGRALPVAVNALRWSDTDGRTLTTLFIRDVAAERERARITQNQMVLSDNAIRGAGIGVFEYDPKADTIVVSDIWRRMLEIAPDEQLDIQKEWHDRVHPDDLARALEPIGLCSTGQIERAACEYRLQSRDRSHWRWMRTDIAVAERDAVGRPSLLVGAQTEITERKLTEESLRISVEQFQSAFFNAPIGKAIVNLDGTFRIVNHALCDMLGYPETDLRNASFHKVTHPEDLPGDLDQLRSLIAGEVASYTREKRYIRANGSVMWGRLSVGLVRDADGKPEHLLSQLVDITDQRRMEELRNEFVSVVSHELRTPLTAVLGALTLLEFEESAFSDDVHRLLFIAKTNGDRLHNLINDILDFQKFTAKEMRFSLARHPIDRLAEETILANLALTDRYGVRFLLAAVDHAPIGLVDPKRFHQVMANLLSNAAKFSEPGGVVAVGTVPDGPAIRVSVTNVGPGIPDSFRDRIFKPFSQAATISDRMSGGTGLGLSISKQIVEQMGGEIGFSSVPGGETTFWFTVVRGD
jgi:PAS domain S-box-containing protein